MKRGYPVNLQEWNLGGLGEKEIGHWEVEVKKNVVIG
jgi:hypothetical protein